MEQIMPKINKFLYCLIIIFVVLLNVSPYQKVVAAITDTQNSELVNDGLLYYEKGQFEDAVLIWEKNLRQISINKNFPKFVDTLRMLANAYQYMGNYTKGINLLTNYINFLEQSNDLKRKALFYSNLGNLYLANNDFNISKLWLEKANNEAQLLNDPYISAVVSNNYGNIYAFKKDYKNALKWYKKSLIYFEHINENYSLKADVNINLIKIFIHGVKERYRTGDYNNLVNNFKKAYIAVEKINNSYEKSQKLISLSILAKNFKEELYQSKKDLDLPVKLLIKGEEFYFNEIWDHAALSWEEATNGLKIKKYTGLYIDVMLNISNLYRYFGQYQQAVNYYQKALPLVQGSIHKDKNAIFLSSLGDLYLFLEQGENALLFLSIALDEAKLSNDPLIIASVLNKKAQAHTALRDFSLAVSSYEQCLNTIQELEPTVEEDISIVIKKTRINILKIKQEISKIKDMLILSQLHYDIFVELDKIEDNLSLMLDTFAIDQESELFSYHCQEILSEIDNSKSFIEPYIYNALNESIDIAQKDNNSRIISYASGFLGKIYESDLLYSDAIKSTQKAIFFAQQGNYNELLYLWYWQYAKLLKNRGDKSSNDLKNAVKAYEMAINILNTSVNRYSCSESIIKREQAPVSLYKVRPSFIKDYFQVKSYENAVSSLYKEMISILFDQLNDDLNKYDIDKKIKRIIYLVERLKKGEIIDFYKDECAARFINKLLFLDNNFINKFDPETAILYPIILNDYIGLILISKKGYFYKKVKLDITKLKNTAKIFRFNLQTKKQEFEIYANQLYKWLIQPVDLELELLKLKNLVIIPDSITKLIPFAALKNNNGFLIEKYAITILPFLYINDFQNEKINHGLVSWNIDRQFLFSEQIGISYHKIKNILKNKTKLDKCLCLSSNSNLDFFSKTIYQNNYSFVYFLHSAKFGDSINNSWIMTSDKKENMTYFQKILCNDSSTKPELLILNRCETDYSNEHAITGLLTLPYKTGSMSTISSLWTNNDEAGLKIIEQYFIAQKNQDISKAMALKIAQNNLLKNEKYKHPSNWAAYILTGNWF